MSLTIELVILVERADHVDFGRADGIPPEEVADHAEELGTPILGRQPAQRTRELDHAGTNPGKVGVLGEAKVTLARDLIVRNRVLRLRECRRLAIGVTQRCEQTLDAFQEHAHFRHVAAEQAVDERELVRRRQPIVDELADLAPMRGARIRVGQAADRDHVLRGKVAEEARTRAARADVGNRRRMEVTAEKVRRRGPQRRDRRKAVDDGHVRENPAHAIAAAFAVQLIQRAREAPSVLRLVPGAHQASPDLGSTVNLTASALSVLHPNR